MKTNEYEMAWQTLKTVLEFAPQIDVNAEPHLTKPKVLELIARIEKQFGIKEQTEQQK